MSTNNADKPKRTRKKVSEQTPVANDPHPVVAHDPKQTPVAKPVKPLPTNPNYYTLDRILNENADYNLIFGERGNGKTYAIQKYAIDRFLQYGEQSFLLRRWVEDTKPSNAQNFLDGNLISQLSDMSGGRFVSYVYRNNWFILVTYDDKGKPVIDDANRFMYVWNVSESERLKGQSFPNVTTIIFEEFISLSTMGYMQNETTLFLHIISTVVRDRTNVKIWLLGNTVNPYNPYFDLFGIKGLDLKQGDIATKYDNATGCKVAIEFCAQRRKGSLFGTSAKYYAFNTKNGSTDSIVTGDWQLPDYPTCKFKQKLSFFKLAVVFDNQLMYVHVMRDNSGSYLFVQNIKNTTQLSKRIWVLDLQPNTKSNYYTSFNNLPVCDTTTLIFDLLSNNKVWYDSRLTGAYFNNFMSQSGVNVRKVMGM